MALVVLDACGDIRSGTFLALWLIFFIIGKAAAFGAILELVLRVVELSTR